MISCFRFSIWTLFTYSEYKSPFRLHFPFYFVILENFIGSFLERFPFLGFVLRCKMAHEISVEARILKIESKIYLKCCNSNIPTNSDVSAEWNASKAMLKSSLFLFFRKLWHIIGFCACLIILLSLVLIWHYFLANLQW